MANILSTFPASGLALAYVLVFGRRAVPGVWIGSFLLLGGVVAVMISPSVGVATMYFTGIINKSQILYTWWNWYVGDTLGVMVFTGWSRST